MQTLVIPLELYMEVYESRFRPCFAHAGRPNSSARRSLQKRISTGTVPFIENTSEKGELSFRPHGFYSALSLWRLAIGHSLGVSVPILSLSLYHALSSNSHLLVSNCLWKKLVPGVHLFFLQRDDKRRCDEATSKLNVVPKNPSTGYRSGAPT